MIDSFADNFIIDYVKNKLSIIGSHKQVCNFHGLYFNHSAQELTKLWKNGSIVFVLYRLFHDFLEKINREH